MFLSKLDALTLSKVLFHYEKLTRHDCDADELDSVFDLSDRITEYLTGEALPKESSDDDPHEEDHEDEIEENDDDDDDDADSEVTLPAHSAVISAEALHDLPPVVATRDLISGELEFEFDTEESEAFVLWNGSILHDDSVVRICRAGKSVVLWTFEGLKISFEIKKLNKEWKTLFADGVVYMVD